MAEIVTASVQANSEIITATLTSGSEQMTAAINVAARGPAGTSADNVWGTITGSLAAQTDLSAALALKANLASPTFTGTVTLPSTTSIGNVSATELGYVDGVTSAIQTQLNTKAPLADPTFTGIVTAPHVEGKATGLELYAKAGQAIAAGQAVYVTGASGANVIIGLAKADVEATSSKTIGICVSTLANNAFGYVVTEGRLTVSISKPTGIVEGDPIWLSPSTAGGLLFGMANKPSAPYHQVYLGVITRINGNTIVELNVHVQNGFELTELSDVDITSPAEGQALMRGATLWENRNLVSADITDATSSNVGNTLVKRDVNGNFYAGDAHLSDLYLYDIALDSESVISSAGGLLTYDCTSAGLTFSVQPSQRILQFINTFGTFSHTFPEVTNGTVALSNQSQTFSNTQTFSGSVNFTSTTRPTSSGTGTPAATSLITRDDADTRYGTPYNLFLTSDISSSSTTYVDGSQTITLPAGTYEVDASLFGLTASATGGVELNVKLSANNDTAVSIQVMKTANISANGSQAATQTTLRNGSSVLSVCFVTHADAANKACAVLVKGTFTLSASTILTPQVKQRTTTDAANAARFLSGSYLRFIKR